MRSKSTGVAVFLSFLIPGLGSLYAGSILGGALILGAWIFGLILTTILIGFPIIFLAWVIGMIHAAAAADRTH